MGYVLKICVCSALLFFLLVNVFHFWDYYVTFLREGMFQGLYPPFLNLDPLTIHGNGGRLGNQMFVLATLYGLSRLNRRDLILMPKNYEVLAPYFELDYPQVDLSKFRARNPWKIGYWLIPQDSSIPSTSNILAGNMYPTSFTFFEHVREEVRNIFRFREPYQKHAQDILHHVKKLRPWTKVFVCVHVRRGDYLRKSNGGWLRAADGREVDIPYFQKSVQYFRSKFRNITFLAVSDDRKWTRDNLSHLGILTLPDLESPGHDLALLSSCNHTIMTYGSFGFWGGYLAGGEVVYFSDFVKPGSKMSKIFVYDKMYPEKWTGISTTPEGFWDNYRNPFIDENFDSNFSQRQIKYIMKNR